MRWFILLGKLVCAGGELFAPYSSVGCLCVDEVAPIQTSYCDRVEARPKSR